MTKIYDEVCGWPYSQPYGMVAAPKKPKVRKPRKSRAKPDWIKTLKKHMGKKAASSSKRTQPRPYRKRTDGRTVFIDKTNEITDAQINQLLAETFTSCAMRECEE